MLTSDGAEATSEDYSGSDLFVLCSKDPQHGSEQTGKGLVQEVEAAARSALDQLKDKLGHVEEKITPTNPIDASLADGKIPLSTAVGPTTHAGHGQHSIWPGI